MAEEIFEAQKGGETGRGSELALPARRQRLAVEVVEANSEGRDVGFLRPRAMAESVPGEGGEPALVAGACAALGRPERLGSRHEASADLGLDHSIDEETGDIGDGGFSERLENVGRKRSRGLESEKQQRRLAVDGAEGQGRRGGRLEDGKEISAAESGRRRAPLRGKAVGEHDLVQGVGAQGALEQLVAVEHRAGAGQAMANRIRRSPPGARASAARPCGNVVRAGRPPPPEQEVTMCRNIRVLHNFDPPTTVEEIRSAALQYVRKVSGLNKPSVQDHDAFDAAVEEVAAATSRLLDALNARGTVRTREGEIVKARERWRQREARIGSAPAEGR